MEQVRVSVVVPTRNRPDQIVASQQKIWMPEGIAMISLEPVKNACPSRGSGVANM